MPADGAVAAWLDDAVRSAAEHLEATVSDRASTSKNAKVPYALRTLSIIKLLRFELISSLL